jgi:hypothetical protein
MKPMLIRNRLIAVCACSITLGSVTLAGTNFVRRWKNTEGPPPTLDKILVLALTDNYIIRQHFEDEMEVQLGKAGAEGIKSHMVMPPRNEASEDEILQRIRESPLDAVMVVRPIEVRTETEETPGSMTYAPLPMYYSFGPYWHSAYHTVYTPGYMKESTIAQVETNIYNCKTEKLIWSGVSDTILQKDMEKDAKNLARALVRQLKKDGFLPRK